MRTSKHYYRRGRAYRDLDYLLLKAQRLAATKTEFCRNQSVIIITPSGNNDHPDGQQNNILSNNAESRNWRVSHRGLSFPGEDHPVHNIFLVGVRRMAIALACAV